MSFEQEVHEGKVVQITDACVHVQIAINDACQHCNSKKSCMIFNARERIIDVNCSNPQDYEIGEIVDLQMKTTIGLKAVWFAYVIPFLVLVGTIIVGVNIMDNELLVVLIAFGILALYYFLIYFKRKKINQIFTFTLLKKG